MADQVAQRRADGLIPQLADASAFLGEVVAVLLAATIVLAMWALSRAENEVVAGRGPGAGRTASASIMSTSASPTAGRQFWTIWPRGIATFAGMPACKSDIFCTKVSKPAERRGI